MPSTFETLAFLVFSSTLELLAIHDYKYGNITITHVAENGSTERSGSNLGSGGFPSSPVQHAITFTAASFLLNH